MDKIEFKGNGSSTVDIETAFYRLVDDLFKLGQRDASFWKKEQRNSKLKAIARQIKNDATTLSGLMRSY